MMIWIWALLLFFMMATARLLHLLQRERDHVEAVRHLAGLYTDMTRVLADRDSWVPINHGRTLEELKCIILED